MLVNKTKAAEIAGVSRRTFYNHIPEKGISVTMDADGSEKIDVSELERVYGYERVQTNLQALEEVEFQPSNDTETAHVQSRGASSQPGRAGGASVNLEIALLKERLSGLEQLKDQMEASARREREQMQEEVENLRDSLKLAQEQQKQLSVLLTDQRKKEDAQVEEGASNKTEEKMSEMSQTIEQLKRQNRKIYMQLQAQRQKEEAQKSKGLLGRLFGQ